MVTPASLISKKPFPTFHFGAMSARAKSSWNSGLPATAMPALPSAAKTGEARTARTPGSSSRSIVGSPLQVHIPVHSRDGRRFPARSFLADAADADGEGLRRRRRKDLFHGLLEHLPTLGTRRIVLPAAAAVVQEPFRPELDDLAH